MKSKFLLKSVLLILVSFISITAAEASFNFSGRAGVSRLSGSSSGGYEKTSTLVGGEFTLGLLDTLELGVFYDRNHLNPDSSKSSGDAQKLSYALVGRAYLPLSNVFVDVRGWRGLEVGAGYRIGLVPMLSLKPELSYHTDSGGYQFVTLSAMLTLSLL